MALLGRRCGHIAAGHLHHMQAFGIQLQGGKFAAPHRAGVDGVDAVADMQTQCAPMAADDIQVARGMAGYRKPRVQPRKLAARSAFVFERDTSARAAIAHAGEDIDDRAIALHPLQAR